MLHEFVRARDVRCLWSVGSEWVSPLTFVSPIHILNLSLALVLVLVLVLVLALALSQSLLRLKALAGQAQALPLPTHLWSEECWVDLTCRSVGDEIDDKQCSDQYPVCAPLFSFPLLPSQVCWVLLTLHYSTCGVGVVNQSYWGRLRESWRTNLQLFLLFTYPITQSRTSFWIRHIIWDIDRITSCTVQYIVRTIDRYYPLSSNRRI